MSVRGIHWAQEMRGVCPFKKALLYALGERHNKDTNLCCPDQKMLAQDAGMSDRTVRKYLGLLRDDGLIEFRTVGRSGGSRVTHYVLRFERRTPQAQGAMRKDTPVRDPEKRAALKRKDLPDQKADRTGKQLPDQTGTLLPFPNEDTKRHEETPTPSGQDLVFEEIWKAFRKVHTANKNISRVKGKAKTRTVFMRKAKKADPSLIRRLAFEEISRQRAKNGGQFLPGLIPWLNSEPWDTGEPVTPVAAAQAQPDWSGALRDWLANKGWPPSLGPKPHEPGYRGPLDPLRTLIAEKDPDHPVIAALRAKLEHAA